MSQAIRFAEQLEDAINAKLYLAPYIAAELRRLHDENKRMRNALQTIANIALLDHGHWAKTIEAEALAAVRSTDNQSHSTRI